MLDYGERFIEPAAAHTKTQKCIMTIRTWIDECLHGHPQCIGLRSARTEDRFLPYRLLYIRQEEGTYRIRLCDSAQLNPAVQYATLSHIWGTGLHFKLTSENMEELRQGVAIADLPGTVRHAVELTSRLSLQHIWVDSLCILQDIKSDWEEECSAMSSAYSGAIINIAASEATNSYGRLFAPRDALTITLGVVSVCNSALGWQNEPCTVWAEDRHQMHIADAPLNKRAWVLQERLLAARTVHFTRTKIFWECPQLLALETDPYCDFEDHRESNITKGWMVPPSKHMPIDVQSTECLEKWKNAVRLYSSGKLTYESDKLVAIAGIARYLHSLWPDSTIKYLAGLWSHGLLWSLLWHRRIETGKYCPRAAQYQAPSWSWAAINAEITFSDTLNHGDEEMARIQDTGTSPTGDPFGAVCGGYVRIRGPLCAALLKYQYFQRQTSIRLEPTDEDAVMSKLLFDHMDHWRNALGRVYPPSICLDLETVSPWCCFKSFEDRRIAP